MLRLSSLLGSRRRVRRVSELQRTAGVELLEDRSLLTPGITFNFELIASDTHPTFRLFGSTDPDDAPFKFARYGKVTMTSLTDLPATQAVVNDPTDLVLEFGSNDAANPETVAALTAFFEGQNASNPGIQNYRTQPGLDSDILLTNDGVPVASGFVETIDVDVAPPAGQGGVPVVTSDNTRVRFTQPEGPDSVIFDEIMDLTNGSGTIVLSLNTFSFNGAATGFGDSELFTGTGSGDIGEGSVLDADDLPNEFIEGAGTVQIHPLTKTDPAGRTRLISTTQPGQGTLVDNGDGTLNFTPNVGDGGSTSFTYQTGLKSLERTASDAEAQDEFGHSVSIHDDTAVVGVPNEDSAADTAGAVYVFERDIDNEWRQVQKLTASDAAAIDRFGYSVHVSGSFIIVGARADDDQGTNSGSAYVFKNTGGVWNELKKLTDPNGRAKDQFGHSVAMDGSTVVVGARLDEGGGTNSGSVFLFEQNLGGTDNFGLVKQVKASDAAGGDQFGFSVSITDDLMIVGSRKDDSDVTSAKDVGSAYIFGRNVGGADNWGQVQKIGGDGAANDWLGYSVAITNTHAIVGKPIRNNRLRIGTATVRGKDVGGVDNWGEVKQLTASSPTNADQFGFSVGLVDENALVGARNDDTDGNNSGAAYHFKQNFGGPDKFDLLATYNGKTNGDALGSNVAVSDDMFLISAPRRDNDGPKSGSVYFEGSTTLTKTVTIDILGAPLVAEGGPAAADAVAAVDPADLSNAVNTAVRQWKQSRLSAAQRAALGNVTFEIADLPGARLGEALAGRVIIDSTAAGFGWFVDATPNDRTDDVVGNRMDLTTVVGHEIGHVLGYSDLYGAEHVDDIMFGRLAAGQRRSVTSPVPLDAVFRHLDDSLNLFPW